MENELVYIRLKKNWVSRNVTIYEVGYLYICANYLLKKQRKCQKKLELPYWL